MLIEYIKNSKNQLGYKIPKGTQTHVTNDAGRQLIADGIAKQISDPEDYSVFLGENESPESSTEKNKSGNVSNKPRSKRKK